MGPLRLQPGMQPELRLMSGVNYCMVLIVCRLQMYLLDAQSQKWVTVTRFQFQPLHVLGCCKMVLGLAFLPRLSVIADGDSTRHRKVVD
jgi:hypothetical protein